MNINKNILVAMLVTMLVIGMVSAVPVGIKWLPANASTSGEEVTFRINISSGAGAVKLKNLSLYGNWMGSWGINESDNYAVNATYSFIIDPIPVGTWKWNVKIYNNDSGTAWANGGNWTVTVTTTTTTTTTLYTPTYQTADMPTVIVDFVGTFIVLMMGENATIVPLIALSLIVALLVGTVMTLVAAGVGLYAAFTKIGGKKK